jgi:hypothetical protein
MNSQTMLSFEMNGRQKKMAETWAWKTESIKPIFIMTFDHRSPNFWFMELRTFLFLDILRFDR